MSDVWQSTPKQVHIDQAWDLNEAMGEREDVQSNGFFPEPAESTVVDSGTGNSKTYRNGVLVEQRLSSKLWTKNLPPNADEPRPKPKGPRTIDELESALQEKFEDLQEELSWYERNAGTNPYAERIVSLKLEIAKLQQKLNPLLEELSSLQLELPPSQKIVKVVADITQDVQNIARESQEAKLRETIETTLDLDYADADRETKKQVLATKKMKVIKDITSPRWSRFAKGPRLEDLHDPAQRVFDGINVITKFLRS